MNSVAWRLPRVMVPVLSSSSVSTSPAASTARPDFASTLTRTRAIHAGDADGREQTADGRGMRVTNSATRTDDRTAPPHRRQLGMVT